MSINEQDSCPCGSGAVYGECCGPILEGRTKARTAEALMRARYSAYATGHIPFLKESGTKRVQDEFDEKVSSAWSKAATWHGLTIIRTEKGTEDDTEGIVEFRAKYTANNEYCNHRERASFVKEADGWKFDDGVLTGEEPERRETPKVGRNDPCPCGSGKKYKKCCGARAS